MAFFDRRSVLGHLVKRIIDGSVALTALMFLAPVLAVAGLGIKFNSPGPIFYRARRMGKDGTVFSMFKFRTMHVNSEGASAITAPNDRRIFAFGLWLRRLKIDELPQFWNVVVGDMSLVGPRPEDPKIVERNYTDWMRETLLVIPGVTGPGSIYGYIYGDALLDDADPEGSYASNLLKPKLALERAYMERAGVMGDLGYLLLTFAAILATILGRKIPLPAADVAMAIRWAPDGRYPEARSG